MTASEADQALSRFLQFRVEQRSLAGLYPGAVALARTAHLSSIYDALYVALAQIEGVELWTADARLIRELDARTPWVKALATYPLHGARGNAL